MHFFEQIAQNDCFALQQQCETWQDAVKLACNMLEQKGFVTSAYYEGILESTQKNGPYYVVAPGFAMPHTRPENGVISTSFSLVTLAEGINFDCENDPVKVILVFAAKDKKEMTEEVIVQIMDFLDDDDAVEKISSAKNKNDILACVK